MRISDCSSDVCSSDLSKLVGDDLESIATLGFRGEALPSIASVAALTIESRPADGEGWRIRVDNGRMVADEPAAAPPGTRVTVENLFAQVPARRKFLRSDRAALGACVDVVCSLALSRPATDFRSDGAPVGERRCK